MIRSGTVPVRRLFTFWFSFLIPRRRPTTPRHEMGYFGIHTAYEPPEWIRERDVTDVHESLSMMCDSKVMSLGHSPGVGGRLEANILTNIAPALNNDGVNVGGYGFEDVHGAPWDFPIQKNVLDFFFRVLRECDIDVPK